MMENKGRLMKYSTFLNSAILELFMFSFSGNGLIDEVQTNRSMIELLSRFSLRFVRVTGK